MKKLQLALLLFITAALSGVEGCDQSLLERLQAMQQQQLNSNQTEDSSTSLSQNKNSFTVNDLSETFKSLEEDGTLLSASECSSLIDTTPRGVACLHCTQPEARTQAMVLASMLHKSCLKNIAINYLVDGTFSFDAQLLIDQIALLSEGDRTVFVYFYLTNGSTPRKWQATTIDAFATKMPPEKFRSAIVNDIELRAQYQQLVMRLVPVLRAAAEYGAQVSLVLGLEDNLTLPSFMSLYDLTIETLPSTIAVAIGRNPCPGCYPGNDSVIPEGVFEEVHTINPATDVRDGLITNDGRNYKRSEIENLAALRDRATALNSAFILWSAEKQGLPANLEGVYPAPAGRTYEIPSLAEQKEIIYFLRGFKSE